MDSSKTVLIGYQRKINLADISSLIEGTSKLEIFNPNPCKVTAAPLSASKGNYDGEANTSALRAFCVLSAHAMLQTKDYRGDAIVVKDLVDCVNSLIASIPKDESSYQVRGVP